MAANNPHVTKLPKAEITIGRIDWIVNHCAGKKVLHLGCVDEGFTRERFSDGTLMHTRLLKVCKEVWGVDTSVAGLEFLKSMGVKNLLEGNVEQLGQIDNLVGQDFDIVLVAEVIEHLNNPGLFLQGAKQLFSAKSEMIITVPNCFRLTGFWEGLNGYELVHPDHNYWFSYKTLNTLLSKSGYEVKEMLVYSYLDYEIMGFLKKILNPVRQRTQITHSDGDMRRPNTQQKRRNPIARAINALKTTNAVIIRQILYKRNPFLADGVIAIVKPKN